MGVLLNAVQNIFDPSGSANRSKKFGDSIANSRNEDFRNSANKYQQTIDSNTGDAGYNKSSNMAKNTAGIIANQAAANSLGNRMAAGMTRGRAQMDSGQDAANTYSNVFAGQQNAASQQLANQLNAQGTLMGANLQNNQAEYQQAWGNVSNGEKANLGLSGLIGSDKRLKDSVKVGIDGDEDCRMARYKRAGEKLKRMNPNKWNELKWRTE